MNLTLPNEIELNYNLVEKSLEFESPSSPIFGANTEILKEINTEDKIETRRLIYHSKNKIEKENIKNIDNYNEKDKIISDLNEKCSAIFHENILLKQLLTQKENILMNYEKEKDSIYEKINKLENKILLILDENKNLIENNEFYKKEIRNFEERNKNFDDEINYEFQEKNKKEFENKINIIEENFYNQIKEFHSIFIQKENQLENHQINLKEQEINYKKQIKILEEKIKNLFDENIKLREEKKNFYSKTDNIFIEKEINFESSLIKMEYEGKLALMNQKYMVLEQKYIKLKIDNQNLLSEIQKLSIKKL